MKKTTLYLIALVGMLTACGPNAAERRYERTRDSLNTVSETISTQYDERIDSLEALETTHRNEAAKLLRERDGDTLHP